MSLTMLITKNQPAIDLNSLPSWNFYSSDGNTKTNKAINKYIHNQKKIYIYMKTGNE